MTRDRMQDSWHPRDSDLDSGRPSTLAARAGTKQLGKALLDAEPDAGHDDRDSCSSRGEIERDTGFEPATFCLGSRLPRPALCPELRDGGSTLACPRPHTAPRTARLTGGSDGSWAPVRP